MRAGDFIQSDQSVATIETDKVSIEVSYTGSKPGVLTSIDIAKGDKVTVGQAIATVDDSQDTTAAESKPEPERTQETPKKLKVEKQGDEDKVRWPSCCCDFHSVVCCARQRVRMQYHGESVTGFQVMTDTSLPFICRKRRRRKSSQRPKSQQAQHPSNRVHRSRTQPNLVSAVNAE
jgi:pyruvate/2-oxoglutarate dehydrogenase complex dihydrolipoamide acyltransferase (E2) component